MHQDTETEDAHGFHHLHEVTWTDDGIGLGLSRLQIRHLKQGHWQVRTFNRSGVRLFARLRTHDWFRMENLNCSRGPLGPTAGNGQQLI